MLGLHVLNSLLDFKIFPTEGTKSSGWYVTNQLQSEYHTVATLVT